VRKASGHEFMIPCAPSVAKLGRRIINGCNLQVLFMVEHLGLMVPPAKVHVNCSTQSLSQVHSFGWAADCHRQVPIRLGGLYPQKFYEDMRLVSKRIRTKIDSEVGLAVRDLLK